MENWTQQAYFGETVLNPAGLSAILVLGCMLLLVPRRWATLPILAMACFVAPAQRISLFSVNFDLLRVMVMFATFRILVRSEWHGFLLQPMDIALIAFAIAGAVVYCAQWMSIDTVKYEAGELYDIVGIYFVIRCLLQSWDDLERFVLSGAVLSILVAIAFVAEHTTGINVFGLMGGVPEVTVIRDGRMRCQGAFAHPILAGCFWAGLLPLIIALWWSGSIRKFWSVIGVGCSLLIIVLCASSTPISGAMVAILGMLMFRVRFRMRTVRWCVLALAVLLQMVMQNPIWHLICRIDFAGGSTAWHRVNLINGFFTHFGEWWLLGTRSVDHWGVWAGDVTNQYILDGVRGGLVTLVVFLILIGYGFRGVGRLIRSADASERQSRLAWALGVALFVHCVNFIGVCYFGQINLIWYLTLAAICSLSVSSRPFRAGHGRQYVQKTSKVERSLIARPHTSRKFVGRWSHSL